MKSREVTRKRIKGLIGEYIGERGDGIKVAQNSGQVKPTFKEDVLTKESIKGLITQVEEAKSSLHRGFTVTAIFCQGNLK